ncbi:hypothetical protein SASPL_156757 [Salvia splendens]|uniref:Uncharacterized protein n=1 Tax=Salvia splendens TaxID=180675 RepID=A0A8X8VW46_SALSN|nr:hypothetical protein SASPL_156757 [Salvia splendens]
MMQTWPQREEVKVTYNGSQSVGASGGLSGLVKLERTRHSWLKREEEVVIMALHDIVAGGWKADNGFRPGHSKMIYNVLKREIANTELKVTAHINSKIGTWKPQPNSGVLPFEFTIYYCPKDHHDFMVDTYGAALACSKMLNVGLPDHAQWYVQLGIQDDLWGLGPGWPLFAHYSHFKERDLLTFTYNEDDFFMSRVCMETYRNTTRVSSRGKMSMIRMSACPLKVLPLSSTEFNEHGEEEDAFDIQLPPVADAPLNPNDGAATNQTVEHNKKSDSTGRAPDLELKLSVAIWRCYLECCRSVRSSLRLEVLFGMLSSPQQVGGSGSPVVGMSS